LMSVFRMSSFIFCNTGSLNWKKLNCISSSRSELLFVDVFGDERKGCTADDES